MTSSSRSAPGTGKLHKDSFQGWLIDDHVLKDGERFEILSADDQWIRVSYQNRRCVLSLNYCKVFVRSADGQRGALAAEVHGGASISNNERVDCSRTPRLDALRRSVARAQAEKLKRLGAEYRGLRKPAPAPAPTPVKRPLGAKLEVWVIVAAVLLIACAVLA